jgi:hypothetical protein
MFGLLAGALGLLVGACGLLTGALDLGGKKRYASLESICANGRFGERADQCLIRRAQPTRFARVGITVALRRTDGHRRSGALGTGPCRLLRLVVHQPLLPAVDQTAEMKEPGYSAH